MTGFSDVDASNRADELAAYLRAADAGLAAAKAYMAAAVRRAVDDGPVLDLGCGLGHDLVRIEASGLDAIGIDASREMLARSLEHPIVRRLALADAQALPFCAGAFSACRIERVLQHVAEPRRVLAEVSRVVRAGGCLVAFEPDYGTFRVDSDLPEGATLPFGLLRVRHPRVGGELRSMAEEAGFVVEDVVTEASFGQAVDELPIDVTAVLRRAVADGRVSAAVADAWLEEQRQRTDLGTFRSSWDKILVVASRHP